MILTDSAEEASRSRHEDIVAQTALALNAEAREKALALVDEGKAQEAAALLHQRRDRLAVLAPGMGAAAPVMTQEAGVLEQLADHIAAFGGLSSYERKQALNEAYIQKNQQAPVLVSADVSPDMSGDRR